MLAAQRHNLILDALRRDGTVRVKSLSSDLDVSEMTIRRDLDSLERKNLLAKVHGGATRLADRSTNEPGFAVKRRRQQAEKRAIALEALTMVEPGSSIGLTAGTTTWTLAKELLDVPDLTVVTNSPSIAQVFYGAPRHDLTVVLTGGIRTKSDALVGPIATGALSSLHIDQLFAGVHGMDADLGFTTPNLAEAELDQAFIRASRRLIVLADHTKWTVRGLAQIAPLGRADVVVTDDQIAAQAIDAFAELPAELRRVRVDTI